MADKIRIAILDDYQKVALEMADWNRLPDHIELEVFHHHLGSSSQVINALSTFDVICIMRERTAFGREVFDSLPRLKLLITSGAKNAAVDLQAATDNDVLVCGTSSPGHAASELAWGLILALSRQIVTEDKAMRNGLWQTTIGRDLKGQTLGILGLGRHGSNVAGYAKAFGMRVIAWSQNLDQQRCDEVGVDYVDEDTLFKQSDILTIHLKMGQRYRGFIGAKVFQKMKSTAFLVNTSRGPIIREGELIAAINNGQIAGAGLDVYEQEPLHADHPLRSLPNTVLTSHVGFVTEQTYKVFYGEMIEAIEAWLNGTPIRILE